MVRACPTLAPPARLSRAPQAVCFPATLQIVGAVPALGGDGEEKLT
jgi:hypothetical protein